MAVIDFPSSPTIGQVHVQNDLSWIWTGTTWDIYTEYPDTPIANVYNTLSDMINDQENQYSNFIYYVISTNTYYQKLNTNTSSINDYRILSVNIYNSNGILTDNRVLSLSGSTLDISGSTITRYFSNGNIGINTTTDNGYKLDVSGTTRISSDLTIYPTNATGDFLTVDSSNIVRRRTLAQTLLDIDAVPYTGATKNVDLGEFGLSTGYLTFDVTPTNTPGNQGTMYWDDSKETISFIMNGSVQRIGHDFYIYVKNSTGSSIAKGLNVGFAGTDGASGHILIKKFLANGTEPSYYYIGVTAETIDNGEFGHVMILGELSGINTLGYSPNPLLYASTTVAGAFQTTAPVAPNNIILVAAAVNFKNNGEIRIRPTLGSNINTDEGVKITSGTTGDLLQLQSNGLWENKSLSTIIGTAYVPSTRQLTINGTAYDLSADRTWSVGTVTSVSALTIGTTGTDITSTVANGTTTPVITLNIPTASASNRGALSSTDWSTFNGKIGGSIASGQVAFGTGSGTIGGDSGLTWDNTNKRLRPTNIFDIVALTMSATGPIISATATNNVSGLRIDITSDGDVFRLQKSGVTKINFKSTDLLGILTTSPTNTIDVNGDARIRTISNATGNFLTTSATGVIQQRTPAETLSDIGGIGGTIASGQVAFGTGSGTIGGSNDLFWDNTLGTLSITKITSKALFGRPSSDGDSWFGSSGIAGTPTFGGQDYGSYIAHNAYRQSDGAWKHSRTSTIRASKLQVIGGGSSGLSGGFYFDYSANVGTSNISWTNLMHLSTSGSLGILTTSPTNTLDVNGTGRIRNGVSLADTSGNVQIGTTTDAGFKLDVNGTARIQGNLTTNLTAGSVPFIGTSGLLTQDNSNLFWDDTNKRLGVRTILPQFPFEVTAQNDSFGLQMQVRNTLAGGGRIAGISFVVSSATFANTYGFIGVVREVPTVPENSFVIGVKGGTNGGATVTDEKLRVTSNGNIGILTTAPTNTLDVNGTARIRTISNLGSTATRFLVASATGVISERTGAELVSDLGISGGSSPWTDATTYIYRNGPVVVGDTVWSNSTALTVKGNSTASSWVLKVQDSSGSNLIALLNDRRLWMYSDIINLGNNPSGSNGVTIKAYTSSAVNAFSVQDSSSNILFNLNANGQFFFRSDRMQLGLPSSPPATGITVKIPGTGFTNGFAIQDSTNTTNIQIYANGSIITSATRNGFGIVSGVITDGSHFKGASTGTNANFAVDNSAGTRLLSILGNGDFVFSDGGDFQLGTTTGTKIGTATSQKIGFWNATPIVQPSGDILTALQNLGLVASPTLPAGSSSNWTITGSDIYRDSAVAIGRTTIPTNATFAVQSKVSSTGLKFFTAFNNIGSELFYLTQASTIVDSEAYFSGWSFKVGNPTTNLASSGATFKGISSIAGNIFRVLNASNTVVFDIIGNGQVKFPYWDIQVGNPTTNLASSGATFKGISSVAGDVFRVLNGSNAIMFNIVANGNIQLYDSGNLVLGTTTGTKIGTATSQKIGFWNATPIAQPNNTVAINDVLVNIGLRASGGISNFTNNISTTGNVEIGGQAYSSVNSKGNSGTGIVTFDWNDGNIQSVILTGSCTFAFSNPQSGASYQIIIIQDGTGGWSITWPTIYWESKTVPSLTGTANSIDVITLTYDGAKYLGILSTNFGTP